MKFQTWVPPELVETYRALVEDERQFSTLVITAEELETHANRCGFASWIEFDECRKLQLGILHRFLIRAELESVWNGLKLVKSPGKTAASWVYWQTSRAAERWYQIAKLSSANRAAEYKKISALASELAAVLEKYELGHEFDFRLAALFGNNYTEKMLKVLHPKLLENENLQVKVLYQKVLPTLPEMLMQLAEIASEGSIDARPSPVRKINASTAFRTFLIGRLGQCFERMGEYSHTTVAACVAVALDDPDVTPDLVSHIYQKIMD